MIKRRVEIFSAGCPACRKVVEAVKSAACPSCEIEVLDMNSPGGGAGGEEVGLLTVPAVVIDGAVASCCPSRRIDIEALKAAGLGVPL